MGAKEAQAIAGYAPKQRVRTMAQGFTLGFADELEARAVACAAKPRAALVLCRASSTGWMRPRALVHIRAERVWQTAVVGDLGEELDHSSAQRII